MTTYSLGQSVNVAADEGFTLECISYRGTTDTSATITFEKPFYPITAQGNNTFTVEGNMIFYFRKDDTISATYEEGATSYKVVSSTTDGNSTVITVSSEIPGTINYKNIYAPERGTKDGQILWKIVEDPNTISYPWNSYAVFDHTLTIIE